MVAAGLFSAAGQGISMTAAEILTVLTQWTPYLAVGFVWNIIISVSSMAIGTGIGAALAVLRVARGKAPAGAARLATDFARSVPTFVMLYYLAYLVPAGIEVAGVQVAFPGWLKASVALSISVVGFVSDNGAVALRDWRAGNAAAALLFLPNWTAMLLIIVMASSTASLLGVGEIVSRCNTMIAAVGRADLMLWAYVYTMLWFLGFCWPLSLLVERLRRHLAVRLSGVNEITAR